MKDELDVALVKKYPRLFRNRYGDMRETAMCWGFECDDGWYNIIDALCENIVWREKSKRNSRAMALQFNRCLKRAIEGDTRGLEWYFSYDGNITNHVHNMVQRAIERSEFREVPLKPYPVIAVQVKEKFGSLRFYIEGGTDEDYAAIDLAESVSVRTCEVCGSPGKLRGNHWLKTLCDEHAKELNYD